MATDKKKIGEMLIDAGLIQPSQLQEALRHQRIAGGRTGSNLVALGFISEHVLMDFLADQTGYQILDLEKMDIPIDVLRRFPRRLAEQLNVLPVAFKEPKTLVLAMADPSDLNAIDSARFASGLNIEPMVASVTALRQAIQDSYNRADMVPANALAIPSLDTQASIRNTSPGTKYARDPFFDEDGHPLPPPPAQSAAQPSARPATDTLEVTTQPGQLFSEQPMVVHSRPATAPAYRRLESYQTRTLVMGLIRLLQRKGLIGDDELQRYLTALIESGQLLEDENPPEKGTGYNPPIF